VANYNVDIEVAVKGQARIKSLQRELTALQKAVNELRKPIDATPGATKRKQELQLAKDLLSVEKAIKQERSARTAELARQARLIALQRKEEDQIAAQRQRGLTQYNPFPNIAAGVSMSIGPEPDIRKLQRRAEIFDRIAKNRAQNLEREKAFKNLALQSGRAIAQNVGKQKAELRVIEQKSDAQRKLNRLFQDANKIRASYNEERMMRRQQRNQRIGGALSSGLIGGGFPLLFGQGGTAAAGGAIGGLAGGAIGGGFGFALSIIGTAAGQAIEEAEQLNKSIVDLNSGLDGTATNASITSSEIRVLASELKLAKDETVELLAGFKGLGANTEQIKSLARVFGEDVSTAKSLATAKDLRDVGEIILGNVGKIGRERAQQLIDQLAAKDAAVIQLALVTAIAEQEERRLVAQAGQVTFMDRLIAGLAETAGFGMITPESMAADRAAALQEQLSGNRQQTIQDIQDAIEQFRDLEAGLPDPTKPPKKAGSKVDPTIGLKKRLGILNSQIEAEQKIVGLGSEGAAIVRRKLAFEKRIAQIRETGKAERQKLTDLEDISLSKTIETNATKLATLQFEREIAVAVERSGTASEKTLEPVQRKLDALKDRNAFEREYGELIMSGSTTAAAKQVIEAKKQVKEIDELVEKQLRSNEIQINILRVIVAQTIGTDAHAAAQEALNDALERENEIREKGKKAKGEVKGKKTPAENIEAEMKRIKASLNDLVDPANQVILAANAIGDAFSESFKGLITGSMSAQEALANLFKRTADHFADMAAEMIAHAIKMQILGIALNFFGSAASAGASTPQTPAPKTGSAFQGMNPPGQFGSGPGFASPSTFAPPKVGDFSAPSPSLAAEGGYFGGPTRALIGEGGQGEYVIPESKMRESMARYSRGARGASVVPETGGSGTSGEGGGAAVAAPIDVRYTVERINSVDYVTADQFQSGMRQAANQGAKQGEQQTLKRLQMSSSTRKRLGM